MFKNILVIITISLLFFSCQKKADIKEPEPEESIVPEIVSEYEPLSSEQYEPVFEYEYNYEPLSEEEIERLTLILHEQEERYLEGWVTEIHFIHKVNLGIPDGDNYIVLWTEVSRRTNGSISSTWETIYIYSISDKIEHRYFAGAGSSISKVGTNFDIMKNIPGFHIGFDTGASIFDCNGDGIDEIFLYGFYGLGNLIMIKGYDAEKNEIADYCNDYVDFSIIDKDRGPAPLEFTYYKNRNGFKVYKQYEFRIPPVNLINNRYAWYFFAWNDETKQYENIGEYLQDDTDTKYNIHSFSLEHFRDRIEYEWISGGFESLVDLVEIKANIEGGRSFNATVMNASSPTKDISENIIDFDSNGIRAPRRWR
jgi:hypothetical protein